MTESISAFPRPRLQDVLRPASAFKETLDEYTGLCDSGRSALYFAIRSAGLSAGATIWMPSFHCGVEVEAALRAGCTVRFYRVAPDLSCDVEDLERGLRAEPGPVLIIHYYGFPQPAIEHIAELCQQRGVLLIEDCAHALFSQGPSRRLGAYGGVSIFSLRKSLPVLEGGAYQWNGSTQQACEPEILPGDADPLENPYWAAAKFHVRQAIGGRATAAYRRVRWGKQEARDEPENAVLTPVRDGYRRGMSALSRRLASATNPTDVVTRRRRNWEELDARLSDSPGYCKVFERLPGGICPLFLAIWVKNRFNLMQSMREQQIELFAFGTLPHPLVPRGSFPEATRLRRSIVCLPVHQQLREIDLDRMAAALLKLLQPQPALQELRAGG